MNSGTLSLIGSTLANNTSNYSGSQGGGIYNSGNLRITGSTFDSNYSNDGGGIYNGGTLSIKNSTFSRNSTNLNGGAILNAGQLAIESSTIYCNTGGNGVGGVFNSSSGTLDMNNSIVSGNSGNIGPDLSGTMNSGDYNLVLKTSAATLSGTHNITGVNPILGDLANNGGPTDTCAILSTSAAIDAGNSTLTLDQRGLVRPNDLAATRTRRAVMERTLELSSCVWPHKKALILLLIIPLI